nr:hypothetical protein StreXyl84_17190 [Streptomyces sp. Xyl84]
MDGNDGRGPGSYGRFDGGRVEAVGRGVYVGEHRQRTHLDGRLGHLDIAERRNDDLITDSYAGGSEQSSSTHAADAAPAT